MAESVFEWASEADPLPPHVRTAPTDVGSGPAPELAPALPPALLEIRDVTRGYRVGDQDVWALKGVSFRIEPGENVAIMGPSGSGKSTLLHLLGLLDRPTSGSYRFAGAETSLLSDDNLARLRNRAIGFVFQSFNLIPDETSLDNVAAPLVYAGVKRRPRRERAAAAMAKVGLADRMDHRPTQLSGGQRQRVAIARALVTNPPLLLSDEPTGNLDSTATEDILSVMADLHAQGLTLVTITHEFEVAERAQRVLRIGDGYLVADESTGDWAAGNPPRGGRRLDIHSAGGVA